MGLSGFPVLNLRGGDITRGWREFEDEFKLTVQLRELDMGERMEGEGANERAVPSFGERVKLLILLRAVGEEGRSTLSSKGLSISTPDLTYRAALNTLKEHYESKESSYVRTQKFVTVNQCVGEEYIDYLCRVERLSRDLDIFTSDNIVANTALQAVRDSLALVLAVNGLRDRDLCAELIVKLDLTCAQLSSLLRSRSTAEKEVEAMRGGLNVESVRRGHGELTVGAADRRQWGRSGRSPARSPERQREE